MAPPGTLEVPRAGSFHVVIENKTPHPIEPGALLIPPHEFVRSLELKVVPPGARWTWCLDDVPAEVTVVDATQLLGPANAPGLAERPLAAKPTLRLGFDDPATARRVTFTYP